ncbi:hypothetical protein Zmor_023837 [Zophobas morio]|uniref:Uncharacterized protein n=1 Tax=Zophobas morio TaxID=2755281 RepID=A0AA38I1Y7_9CUCU|nr:hypothetical protein Zmor_023837 [Zophobas morio]
MYYEKYKQVLDPFKDIVFKSSREPRDTNRRQLQATPDKRKISSVALTVKEHQEIAKIFDEDMPRGLQLKFYQVAAFELSWRGGEATGCLVEHLKKRPKVTKL